MCIRDSRYRFPVEIVKAVKKACGKEFPVSLRYSVVSKTKGFRQGALPGEAYTEVGREMCIRDSVIGKDEFTLQGEYSQNLIAKVIFGETKPTMKADIDLSLIHISFVKPQLCYNLLAHIKQ